MKIVFSLLFILMACIINSCIKLNPQSPIINKTEILDTKSESAKHIYAVSLSEAIQLVSKTFPDQIVTDTIVIADGIDSLMYIFSFRNSWCAVSGDKRIQPFLGQDDSSVFPQDNCDNPGINTWINSLAYDIKSLKQDGIIKDNEYTSFWASFLNEKKEESFPKSKSGDEPLWALFYDETTFEGSTSTDTVTHLLSTKWGQGSPWNYKCPQGHNSNGTDVTCPTGCTAVALGQILYYTHNRYNVPNGLYHNVTCTGHAYSALDYTVNISTSNYVANSPRWISMALNKYLSNTDYVGDLMMEIGKTTNMSYSGTGSGAWPSISAFNHYGLRCNTGSHDFNIVKNNLIRNRPVLIYAFASQLAPIWPFSGFYSDGHTWVIDGLRELKYHYANHYHLEYTTEYDDAYKTFVDNEIESEFDEYYEGMEVIEHEFTYTYYYYMNWGWDGANDNGMYYLALSHWDVGGYTFQYNKTIFYDILPL